MGAGGVIAAIAGGGALAFLILRKQAKSAPTAPPPKDPCAGLSGDALAACKGVSGVGAILEGVGGAVSDFIDNGRSDYYKQRAQNQLNENATQKANDENNRARNGAIEIPKDPALRCVTGKMTTEGDIGDFSFPGKDRGLASPSSRKGSYWKEVLTGTALRFKNGCVPFEGAPGWEKCAPGTVNMLEQNYVAAGGKAIPITDKSVMTGWVEGTGRAGDAATGFFLGDVPGVYDDRGSFCEALKFNPDGSATGTRIDFPIPIPKGSYGYFYRGKPFTCPYGRRPDFNTAYAGGPIREPVGCGNTIGEQLVGRFGVGLVGTGALIEGALTPTGK